MKRHLPSTPLAALALIALALVLFAGAASAAPPAPTNGLVYRCSAPNGGWSTLKFDLPGSGSYRSGIVYKNGDNRKAALALKGGVWEFTFVNDMQCKKLTVYPGRRGASGLDFQQCTDGIDRSCDFP